MKTLSFEAFKHWLESYGSASAENDPRASAALFAQDARYYESPFTEPLNGRAAIYDYWLKGARTLRDKKSEFEILAVVGQRGIARWRSKFTVSATGQHLALDCLLVVDFDDAGLCHTFREWWHTQEIIPGERKI